MHAFADHGQVKGALTVDGVDAEEVIAEFARHGVDGRSFAARLQREGAGWARHGRNLRKTSIGGLDPETNDI